MTAIELLQLEQGSAEWKDARCGKLTASRFGDVITTTKKGESAARRHYREEIVCEILTGQPAPEPYVSREMQWGKDQEPFARAAYELKYGIFVETCGFVVHPENSRFGCSPDGFVGEDGLIQIKCPNTTTHLAWMLEGQVPLEHAPQMLAELACTGRNWCDFVSYDPRLPEHLQLFIRRMHRNQEHIAQAEEIVSVFLAEVDEVLAQLPQPVVSLLDQVNPDEVQF